MQAEPNPTPASKPVPTVATEGGTAGRPATLTVIYNDACPICRREIAHYRRAAEARVEAGALRFEPLAHGGAERHGLTPDEAARRLHVVRDGRTLRGMAAFRALWSEMPSHRWLARATGLPGLARATDWTYERVAAPLLHALHLRRERRRACGARPGG